MTRLGIVVLAAIDAALLATVLLQAEPTPVPTVPMPAAPPPAAAAPSADDPPPPADARRLAAELLARPVFTPDRRPGPAGAAATAPQSLVLVGVVASKRQRIALVRVDGGATLRLAEGDRIGPLTVVEIAADRIRVRDGATLRDLPLLRTHAPAGGDVAARTPPPPTEPAEAPRID